MAYSRREHLLSLRAGEALLLGRSWKLFVDVCSWEFGAGASRCEASITGARSPSPRAIPCPLASTLLACAPCSALYCLYCSSAHDQLMRQQDFEAEFLGVLDKVSALACLLAWPAYACMRAPTHLPSAGLHAEPLTRLACSLTQDEFDELIEA